MQNQLKVHFECVARGIPVTWSAVANPATFFAIRSVGGEVRSRRVFGFTEYDGQVERCVDRVGEELGLFGEGRREGGVLVGEPFFEGDEERDF